MSVQEIIGWDIGGAHVKAVKRARGGCIEDVVHAPCPLWRELAPFEALIGELCGRLGATACINAVTMTGELADIFANRAGGVAYLAGAMARQLAGADLRIYAGRRGWLEADAAGRHAGDVASANWLASAQLAARAFDSGLLLDIGSTTTDVIAFAGGEVRFEGYSDAERLQSDELVYTGMVRTPVFAIADRLPYAGAMHALAAEVFATSGDVHVLASGLRIDGRFGPAADGGAYDPASCARRLARMIGRDAEPQDLQSWRRLAACIAREQRHAIGRAVERRLSGFAPGAAMGIVGAGIGRGVAQRVAMDLGLPYTDFAEALDVPAELRDAAADCAPAAALAFLCARGPK